MDRNQPRGPAADAPATDPPNRELPRPRSSARASSTLRRLALATALTAACGLAGASGAAAAEPWGFEQVTPPVKGGGAVSGADTFQAGPDGNSFLLTASLPFGSLPLESAPLYSRYLASRGEDGWVNRAQDPSYAMAGGAAQFHIQGVAGTDPGLNYALVASVDALTPGATQGGGNVYVREMRTGKLTLVATDDDPRLALTFTGPLGFTGVKFVASDGRSALFMASSSLTPGAPEGVSTLYAWTAEDGLRAASVLPSGETVGVSSGPGNNSEWGVRDSIAPGDGLAHVYFGAAVEVNGPPSGPLYVRSGGVTKPVSYSRVAGPASPPVPGLIDAIGRDGRYMLFHTRKTDALTADTPPGPLGEWSYLYLYDAADESLEYIGHTGVNGTNGVIEMTPDARTIAFQSDKVLEGMGIDGQVNNFVWRDGSLRFVSTVDFGQSGGLAPAFQRRLSSNGRYLVYTDDSPSTAAMFGAGQVTTACAHPIWGGSGPCNEVYRFDADANGGLGELSCASCRPDGAIGKGHSGDPTTANDGATRLNAHQARTVADDGTVFFVSRNGLVAQDGNGLDDVYAWNDGNLRLVSRASQGKSARFLDATADGETIFFATNDPIAATDGDRAVDIYMTRRGAGFAHVAAPSKSRPCAGSECRESTAPKAPAPLAGSVSLLGRGNVTAARASRVTVSRARVVAGAAGQLKVKVPSRGRIRVSGPGLRSASAGASGAGTYRLVVRLSKRARERLAARQRVTVRLTVRFTPASGAPRAVRLGMTFKAKSTTKKGR
jgi:hypothetical protein